MNYPIKTKAWDTQLRTWSKDFVGITNNGDLMFYNGADRYPTVIPAAKSRCKVVRFTGALDNNGKEIYEGDLVEDTSVDATWLVTWDEEATGWASAPKYGEYVLCYSLAPSCLKVIGNKYENAALLMGAA